MPGAEKRSSSAFKRIESGREIESKADMSKGYKIYLLVIFIIFSIMTLVAWEFGVLELLFDY